MRADVDFMVWQVSYDLADMQRIVRQVKATWGASENNRRAKFYRLTPRGKQQLLREESRWSELVKAIGRVMSPASPSTEE